jgi:hypothetical protein
MYRKQKVTSKPHVGVEELKRQQKRELLGDLKPILEDQGIQFPDSAGVMSEEQCTSSLASTSVSPITIEPMFDQVPHGGGQTQGEHAGPKILASPPPHS